MMKGKKSQNENNHALHSTRCTLFKIDILTTKITVKLLSLDRTFANRLIKTVLAFRAILIFEIKNN